MSERERERERERGRERESATILEGGCQREEERERGREGGREQGRESARMNDIAAHATSRRLLWRERMCETP